jgi:peroxiredoxin
LKSEIGNLALWAAGLLLIAAAPVTQPNQLKLMSDAYLKLKSLSLAGTIGFSGDIDGQTSTRHAEFTDSYVSPMRFRHEVKGDVIAAATGDNVYVFLPNQNVFTEADAPAERGSFTALPDDLRALLRSQDLSLVFALSDHPAEQLLAGATDIQQSGDSVTVTQSSRIVTVTLDPATHLVKRIVIDPSPELRRRGADVKSAKITIEYTQTVPNANVTDEQLAFAPPPTAQKEETEAGDVTALVGKPAPKFTLGKLDGGQVSNASLHGAPYVLEFWNSGSGPCMLSLAALDEMAKRNNVKIFAVNQKEPPDVIKDFIQRLSVTLPVLMDVDGKVSTAYAAADVPEAVVVGADGVVENVFVGAGQEQDIAVAIDAAENHARKPVP